MKPRYHRLVVASSLFLILFATPLHAFHFPWDQGHDTFTPEEPPDKENDNPPPEENRAEDGEPVDLKSGNYYYLNTWHDLVLPSRGPNLALLFTYHSHDVMDGPFGFGWHSSLTQTAIPVSDGAATTVIIRQGDGKRKRFLLKEDGTFQSPPGLCQTLTGEPGGALSLRDQYGFVRRFDASGRLASIGNRYGDELTIAYDAAGAIATAAGEGGRQLQFVKGANGKIAEVVDPLGRRYLYGYNAQGDLTSVTDPLGGVVTYEYDSDHKLTRIVDPAGTVFVRNVYDSDERVIQQFFADGSSYRFQFQSETQTRVTDPRGQQILYEFNDQGNVTRVADPLGRVTVRDWDADFNLVAFTDGNGNMESFSYDACGNLTQYVNAIGSTQQYEYEPAYSNVTSITDAEGNVSSFEYDANGNLVRSIDPLGNVTRMAYDAFGQVTSVIDALANVWRYEYNAFGDLSAIVSPLGNRAEYEYDGAGKVTRMVDAGGRAFLYAYDELDRLVSFQDADGSVSQYQYDAVGNLIQTRDADGNATTFTYDNRRRLVGIDDPLGRTQSSTHDPNGNLTSVTTRNGATITFAYDAANQLVSKSFPDGTNATFAYDNAGNVLSVRDDDSRIDYTYNGANWLLTQSTAAAPLQPAATVLYTHDANGNLTSLATPEGTLDYIFDPGSRLATLAHPSGASLTFEYDANDRRVALRRPTGLDSTYSYDGDNRTSRVLNASPSGAISQFDYQYDAVGNPVSVAQTRSTVSVKPAVAYTFDERDQLINATRLLPAAPDEAFAYDARGNRMNRDGQSLNSTYNAANELQEDETFVYQYDPNGNLISATRKIDSAVTTYGYDYENRLVGVTRPDGVSISYRYDALGRRIEKNVAGAISRYVYDEDDLILEYAGTDNQLVGFYSYGPGVDQPLVAQRDIDGSGSFEADELFYYFTDDLGSVMEIVSGDGSVVDAIVYDAFGNVESGGAFSTLHAFAAREFDAETGFYYCRSRYYDAVAGRFTTRDPMFLAGGLNLYAYVDNNPVRFADPYGLIKRDKNGKVIFTPSGKPQTVTHDSGPSSTVQPGYIEADDGTKIDAFQNLGKKPSEKGFDTDCHGVTFADGGYWVNNDQVEKIIKGDKYKKASTPKVGDKVIYRDKSGNVVHSVTVVNVDPKTGKVTVEGLGGLQTTTSQQPVKPGPGGAWHDPNASYEYQRK